MFAHPTWLAIKDDQPVQKYFRHDTRLEFGNLIGEVLHRCDASGRRMGILSMTYYLFSHSRFKRK
jgi:hypothetical protein